MLRLPRRRVLRVVALVLGIAVALYGWRLYDRPAHEYNTAYEPCWYEAALVAIGAPAAFGAPSTFAPRMCGLPSGILPGVGHLRGTWPITSIPGHDLVIFATASSDRGDEGLAYAVGEPPPSNNCVFPLGGPWWQLAFRNLSSMSCPRGFTLQSGP